jgi:hypothetical protein
MYYLPKSGIKLNRRFTSTFDTITDLSQITVFPISTPLLCSDRSTPRIVSVICMLPRMEVFEVMILNNAGTTTSTATATQVVLLTSSAIIRAICTLIHPHGHDMPIKARNVASQRFAKQRLIRPLYLFLFRLKYR